MSRIGLLFAFLIVPAALCAQVATPPAGQPETKPIGLILGKIAWCGGTTPPASLQAARPCELGDVLHVPVTNLDEWMSAAKDKNKLPDLVLVLNGRVLKGLSPYQDGSDGKLIDFDLRRLSEADPDGKENRAGWTALLSGSKYANILDVAVALGGVPPNFGGAKVAFNASPNCKPFPSRPSWPRCWWLSFFWRAKAISSGTRPLPRVSPAGPIVSPVAKWRGGSSS
jgi:hypothetical protein